MMFLEFIGIIGAAIAAIAIIGMVAAGASVVLLSLVGFLKELLYINRKNQVSRNEPSVFNQVA